VEVVFDGLRMEATSERGLFGSLIPLLSCGGDRESSQARG